jgi:hypothetical protein
LTAPAATAPDADYDGLRAAVIARIAELSGATWTDQNEADPGITLAEVAAWGLADLHYRVGARGLDSWPLSLLLTAPVPGLHSPARAAHVAEGLSRPDPSTLPVAWTLADEVAHAVTRSDAQRLVETAVAATGPGLTAAEADVAAELLRRDVVRRATLDKSGAVHAAVEEAAAGLPGGTPQAAVDATAVQLLQQDSDLTGLWPDEVAALVARERERRSLSAVAAAAPAMRSATTESEVAAITADLVAAGVPAGLADLAVALSPRPGDRAPEYWETGDGATRVWPPAPDQSLRCEPVTGDDYAARARSVAGVRRAWAVAGTLPGIAWHGGRTVVTDRRGTVTLLVERDHDRQLDGAPETDDGLLRRVLAEVLGESAAPWSALGARRMLCDEVGAAIVRHHPVTISGILHVPVGTDTARVVTGARARVAAYLGTGRPHSRAGGSGPGRGPWPDAPQPPTGWEPGEAIPVTELVQVLAADPLVLGVSEVSASVKDGPLLRDPARVCATAPVTPQGTGAVDSVTLAEGDRVLLTAQDNPADNGVYVVATGDWTRAADLASGDSQCLSLVPVTGGTRAGTTWAQTSDVPLAVGTDPLVWEQSDRTVLPDVRVVATVPVTPSGQPRLAGVRLFDGDRVLLTAQPAARDNGIYVVAAGAWTRAATTATTPLPGAAVRVAEGTDAGSTWWLSTAAPITVGATPQIWVRSGAAQPPGSGPTGEIRIPAGAVPVLGEVDCLQVRLTTGPEATDAQS